MLIQYQEEGAYNKGPCADEAGFGLEVIIWPEGHP